MEVVTFFALFVPAGLAAGWAMRRRRQSIQKAAGRIQQILECYIQDVDPLHQIAQLCSERADLLERLGADGEWVAISKLQPRMRLVYYGVGRIQGWTNGIFARRFSPRLQRRNRRRNYVTSPDTLEHGDANQ